MSNSAKIKRGDKMSEQITITMTREELIEIIEKVAIREKFFIRNSVKLSIADAILSAGSQKKREVSFDKEKLATLNELVNSTGIK